MIRSYIKYFICITIMIGFTACGDSSTGSDSSEPPTTPELEKAEPDISFFENNKPQRPKGKAQKGTGAYYNAYLKASTGAIYTNIGKAYSRFFDQADGKNANYDDGKWSWTYSYSYQGIQAEWRRTAEELTDGSFKWALFYSLDTGKTKIDDYKLIGGTASKDGMDGSWTFNVQSTDSNDEVPLIKSEWEYQDDSHGTLDITIYNADGSVSETIEYTQSGHDFTMSFSDKGDKDYVDIGWHDDTKIGYYEDSDGKGCWDDSFEDVQCSTAGL